MNRWKQKNVLRFLAERNPAGGAPSGLKDYKRGQEQRPDRQKCGEVADSCSQVMFQLLF